MATLKACVYRKIDIPISKSLYMKISEMMKKDNHNVWLTDSEIAEFTQHLSLFMDEKVPILYQIDYQTRCDEKLMDRIKKFCFTQHAAGIKHS
ncbi:putative LRR containing protein [Trachipleistophora hominis]|uniref:Putative LRR containing protein n=1 Tax=Trachipleistophora hominis TaxID=72359 RepID=L7JVY8_TRAHO|nr:putative LRR containing protein [Trachipleistophora hominis]